MKNLYATGQQVLPLVFSTNDHLWGHTNGLDQPGHWCGKKEKSSTKTTTCLDYGQWEEWECEQGPKLNIFNFVFLPQGQAIVSIN